MGRKKSYKIFDLDYLQNAELTEDDLYYLFETPSLNYSLLVDMFNFTNQEITDEKKIIKLAKTDRDWMYKYFWTAEQREEFEKILTKIFMNVYWCRHEYEAESKMQWWIFMYGLTNEDLKDKKISKLNE